ncbi:MAG: phospholipase D-like domain-containing protein [Vicinamibacteria bacterium]
MPEASAPSALPAPAPPTIGRAARLLAAQAFDRAAGAPLVAGNAVRLLRDAAENYPAWLDAIHGARRHVHVEAYILADDATGRAFADALVERARAGVKVRVVQDWLGGVGKAGRRFWRRLREAGVEVRTFNPPSFLAPFDVVRRNHRKSIVVDHEVAFVTGLCLADAWAGDPARGVEPWRDTGIELRGPAVLDVAKAFADTWAETGAPLPDEDAPRASSPRAGDVALRVVAGTTLAAATYRLDTLVAALAVRRLWLADAYFAGNAPYVQALRAAAQDGVDVRLLVPGAGTDNPLVQRISRAGYRALLEAGVRVFEWNGPMMHAKTAVADGHWARIGSTNLNLASWMGNWELDVVVEDDVFGVAMEWMYEQDLASSTEIVLGSRVLGPGVTVKPLVRSPHRRRRATARARRAAAGAVRLGYTIGAAVAGRRTLGSAEASLAGRGGILLLVLAAVTLVWPLVTAVPAAVLAAWLGLALLVRAWRLRQR